jgi:hypothetical protein
MSALLGDFINTYERVGLHQNNPPAFVKWSRVHFPRVTEITVTKQNDYTFVEGLTSDNIPLFTLRHVPDLTPPKGVDNRYVYHLWTKHVEQRIHISEFKDFFGKWIRVNFPNVKYVYIKAHTHNTWSVSLDDAFTFEVPC